MVLFSRGSIGVLRGGGAARRRRRRDARAAMHFLPGVLRESYLLHKCAKFSLEFRMRRKNEIQNPKLNFEFEI
jgi:hypothetical protein